MDSRYIRKAINIFHSNIDPRIYDYPLFISYPRTGCHWVNCAMELYFDRPRLRENRVTFLEDPSRADWMWFHDHDINLKIRHDNVLYLYRNPMDTIYSLLVYNKKNVSRWFPQYYFSTDKGSFTESSISKACSEYRQHLIKWLTSENKARTIINYERLVSDPQKEFSKVCRHFNVEFKEERMWWSFKIVKKEKIVDQAERSGGGFRGIRKDMLTKEYNTRRDMFRREWEDYIWNTMICTNLEPFFSTD